MIRLGIVDFDSSHSVEFTRRLNQHGISPDQFVSGAKVTHGYAGGIDATRERVDRNTAHIRDCGVELVHDPRELIGKVDAVMVLSVAGDQHLQAARPFLEARVPLYVDKPITCRSSELEELIQLAESQGTLLWSSSAIRFCDDIMQSRDAMSRLGKISGLQVFGPAHESPINRGLFHYAIHITEAMFTLMGTGCERLTALSSPDCDLIGGRWTDGRIASLRGHRSGNTGYGFTCFTSEGILHRNFSLRTAYRNLCREIVQAFTTNTPPVSLQETREIVRFLEAAEQSRRDDALPVSLN